MLNLETHKIIHTQDVTWLEKPYDEFMNINRTNPILLDDSNDEDGNESGRDNEAGRDKDGDKAIIVETDTAVDNL
jgi:hypothetical protein